MLGGYGVEIVGFYIGYCFMGVDICEAIYRWIDWYELNVGIKILLLEI